MWPSIYNLNGPFVEHYVIHEFLPSDSKNSHTAQALCQYAVMGLMAQNSFHLRLNSNLAFQIKQVFLQGCIKLKEQSQSKVIPTYI